ncbi:MAG: DUF1848 domain-containing protein [Pseudomonadota bacterium]
MIISASRRTDIPAFHAPWFMNRIRAGFVLVPNPFNPKQIRRVSLAPGDVSGLVFWTRNPEPLLTGLDELDRRGFPYYFLFTITGLPRILEKNTLPPDRAAEIFRRLSTRLGPGRVVWRFDPVIITDVSPPGAILENFTVLAERLSGSTDRVIFSFAEIYRKVKKNLDRLEREEGVRCRDLAASPGEMTDLAGKLAEVAAARGLRLQACCPQVDLTPAGLVPGKCVDPALLPGLTPEDFPRDKTQRPGCNCVASADIGQYDSCLHGCVYCYAVKNPEAALANRKRHDPDSPFMLGKPEDYPATPDPVQGRLF